MCGVLGSFSVESSQATDRRFFEALDVLHHRGPDDKGLERISTKSGSLILGHTRLSIIDLTEAGHQPRRSFNGRYSLVFNGEIYNYLELRRELKLKGHTFTSQSDTEVLIEAWDEWNRDALSRLVGMFSFAVYDHTENTLTLVRDAFGIKPLFVFMRQDRCYFASEIQPLLKLIGSVPEVNIQRAYDYLVWGRYDDKTETFFEGIKHVPAGHLLKIRMDDESQTLKSELRPWWLPEIAEKTNFRFEDAVEQVRELFLSNVRLHLRSDVPIGFALSGGIDSSAIVCAARRIEPSIPIRTFSYLSNDKNDEEKWVDKVNQSVNAIPTKFSFETDDLCEDLERLVGLQGEPFQSTSIYAQNLVFRKMRESGITVSLDGQGADELFAGYNGYPAQRMASLIGESRYRELASFVFHWARHPGRSYREAIRSLGINCTPNYLRDFASSLAGKSPFPKWCNRKFLIDHGVRSISPYAIVPCEFEGRKLVAALRASLNGGGLASLLRHADRNSMFWSIESRVPFLTTEMAELTLRLPEQFLVSDRGVTKHVFKEAMRGIVPDSIVDRKDKIGFESPVNSDLISYASTWINRHAKQLSLPIFNQTEIEKIFDVRNSTSVRNLAPCWRIFNFYLWCKQYQAIS